LLFRQIRTSQRSEALPCLRRHFIMICAVILFAVCISAQEQPAYRNPKLAIEDRVADLLSRMDLGGKKSINSPEATATGIPGYDGSIHAGNGSGRLPRPLQSRKAPQTSRSGRLSQRRPTLSNGKRRAWDPRALHWRGPPRVHGRTAPRASRKCWAWQARGTPIWWQQVFTAAADEMASTGDNQAFTPVLDLARDPRWGRTKKLTRDPFLVSAHGRCGYRRSAGTHVPDRSPSRAGDGEALRGRTASRGREEYCSCKLFGAILRETFLCRFKRLWRKRAWKRDGFLQRNRRHTFAH